MDPKHLQMPPLHFFCISSSVFPANTFLGATKPPGTCVHHLGTLFFGEKGQWKNLEGMQKWGGMEELGGGQHHSQNKAVAASLRRTQ